MVLQPKPPARKQTAAPENLGTSEEAPRGPPCLPGWVGPMGQEARAGLKDGTQGELGLSQG